jgi:Bifunctional DNA primase/polymerase, N-terminal
MSASADLLEQALAYAGRGWPVLPLKPRDKIPLIPKTRGGNGVRDATTDRDLIKSWWRSCPTANIGIACGIAFWVLDLDHPDPVVDKPDGLATLAALEARHGRLPETMEAATGSGGRHLLFAPDPRITNKVRVLPGIDTRSIGGYIAASPSIHPLGVSYQWVLPERSVSTKRDELRLA